MYDFEYDYEITELKDFTFNHYIHHYDECEHGIIHFNEEYDCIEPLAGCVEEIEWN